MGSTILQATEIKKSYVRGDQRVDALKGVSVTIQKGQMTSIMGPSGSGKSTFMHILGGLDRPTSGHVILNGQAIDTFSDDQLSEFRRRRLGFIFQFFNLLPTLTALENVALPMLLDGVPISKIAPKAKDLLSMMGLGKRLDHHPDQLSGGEMQRVAIARALVTDPLLILADEPTGNLDSKTGASVLELLAKMAEEGGQTIVMVTHDPRAATYGHRLITLRDGLLEADELISHRAGKPAVNAADADSLSLDRTRDGAARSALAGSTQPPNSATSNTERVGATAKEESPLA